jgi:hypothetical protein
MLVAEMIAMKGLKEKIPIRVKNSEIKPVVRGIAELAREKNRRIRISSG